MDNEVTVEFDDPSDPFRSDQRRVTVDKRKSACPYCRKSLKKVPSAKTKCPHCGEVMFVRTSYRDNVRVVVTAEEANVIEDDWRVVRGAREPDFANLTTTQEVEAERQRLKEAFLKKGHSEPSDDDVKWSLLNKLAMRHAEEGSLGLCRNTYLMMAEFLTRKWKLAEALKLNLLVCAYDLNGAQNRGGLSSDMLRQFPLFDPMMATLAPVVVGQVQVIAKSLGMATEDVHRQFLEATSKCRFPLFAEKTWPLLSLALEGKIDLTDQPKCFQEIRSFLTR